MDGFSEVLIDAIKILGPATIAAIVALKSARLQTEARIREFEEKHRFGARSQLFEFYRVRLDQTSEKSAQVAKSLGRILGLIGAAGSPSEDLDVFFKLATSMSRQAPTELSIALTQMSDAGLENTETYKALRECESLADWNTPVDDKEVILDRLLSLQELYSRVAAASLACIQHEVQAVLAPYLDK